MILKILRISVSIIFILISLLTPLEVNDPFYGQVLIGYLHILSLSLIIISIKTDKDRPLFDNHRVFLFAPITRGALVFKEFKYYLLKWDAVILNASFVYFIETSFGYITNSFKIWLPFLFFFQYVIFLSTFLFLKTLFKSHARYVKEVGNILILFLTILIAINALRNSEAGVILNDLYPFTGGLFLIFNPIYNNLLYLSYPIFLLLILVILIKNNTKEWIN